MGAIRARSRAHILAPVAAAWVGLVLAEVVFSVTDPPIKVVRRVIPPLRVGGAALDFAWSIVMLACIILISVTLGFVN